MNIRTPFLYTLIVITLLSGCGTPAAVQPTPTPTKLPPTSTKIPPTITPVPPTSTAVPPTVTATQTPTEAPTRISPAPDLDPAMGRVEGVFSHSKAGPLAKFQVRLLDPNKDKSDPTASIVKAETGADGYYFLDAEPGAYTLDVDKFTHVESDYPCSQPPTVGQVQFGFLQVSPDLTFAYGYGRPKQNDWLVTGFVNDLILEAGQVIEINMEIDC